MNDNDKRIIELKKKIEEKKEQLGKSTRFVPKTNCLLTLFGQNYNLHVLTLEQVGELYVLLDFLQERSEVLGVNLVISGYGVRDWLDDVKSKFQVMNRKEEEAKLKSLELTLSKLLSLETQTKLAIEDIEKLL